MINSVDLLIYNIREIVTPIGIPPKKGKFLNEIEVINNGAIAINEGKIVDVLRTNEIKDLYKGEVELDLKNENIVLPGFVDPHTHLIFGGSREEEFLKRLLGYSYLDIQKSGGGIKKTKNDTFSIPEEKLIEETKKRLMIGSSYGITTFEIKSGYGLEIDKEIKLLKLINRIKSEEKLEIVPTFLLHLIPEGESNEIFIKKVVKETLPYLKRENLTSFLDIFVEDGAFTKDLADEIIGEAKKLDFYISLHVDQFNNIGGIELALKYNVKSVSHIDLTKKDDLILIGEKDIIGIIFPLERLIFSREPKRGREVIDLGVPISISTDFNPGTSPSLNFPLILSLAMIREGLTIEEAINSSTINSAYALNLHNEIGSIEKGKRADLVIFELDSYKKIPYFVGMNFIKYVIINGEVKKDV